MRVHVKELYYWKTEHGDINRCQDAYTVDPERGLFVVTDGAGTTLYPATWARILAQHFLDLPLMSKDPFEIEWWVRLAQEQYKKEVPGRDAMIEWNARQKALNEGSDATLATLRIVDVTPSSAQAQLLVFGDSCVIVGKTAKQEIASFVLQKPEEFERGPICIPSELRFFKRGFHTCAMKRIELHADDLVILATDAVCKWILSSGDGKYARPWDAFAKISKLRPGEDWYHFIDTLRSLKQIVDDDSTALVLEFKESTDADDTIELKPQFVELHPTVKHQDASIQQRKRAFEDAQRLQNKELMAINYGDGVDLNAAGLRLSAKERDHIREVADALREVLSALQQAKNTPNLPAKVGNIWQKHVRLLLNEPCAENVRETLRNMQIPLEPPLPPPKPPDNSGPQTSPITWEQWTKLQSDNAKLQERVKKAELARDLLSAILNEDYDTLLKICDDIECFWSLHELYKLAPQVQGRTDWAYQQRDILKNLQKILRRGSVHEIASARQPAPIFYKNLSDDEQQQVQLAIQFTEAEKARDDKLLIETERKMHHPQYYNRFHFTHEERKSVTTAEKRINALNRFRSVSGGSGGTSARRIVDSYDQTLLDDYPGLTESERELISLAREFESASKADDLPALLRAYENIIASPHRDQFAFTVAMGKRIEQARQYRLPIATVDGREVYLEQLKKVFVIKPFYIKYLLSSHYYAFPEPEAKRLIQDQAKQQSQYLQSHPARLTPQFILNDLIDDLLIQDEIKRLLAGGVHRRHFDMSGFPAVVEAFKRYIDPEIFLHKNGLTEKDVEEVLSIFVRREIVAWYLKKYGTFGSKDLEEKLKRLREASSIEYNRQGVDLDGNLRPDWLLLLLEQK